MKWKPLLWAVLLFWHCAAQADLLPPLANNDAYKAILIEGQDLPMALSLPLDQLSLAAVVDDQLTAIPFQIDQYNQGGDPYFEGWDIPMAGKPGVLNPTDKLLFIYKDAGPRFHPGPPTDGRILAQIRLHGTDGVDRYVYLMRGARLRSDDQYVRYSPELGRVETDFYTLRYHGSDHLKWDDVQFNGYLGDRPLDNLKLQVSGGAVFKSMRLVLGNDNMVAKPVGAIIGPIRTVTQADFTVHFMGIQLARFSLQVFHYPKSVMYDMRGSMPEFLRRFARDPKVSMVVDANDMIGAEIRTATGPTQPAIVDGKMGAIENAMLNSPMTRAKNWVWLHSKRNLDLIAFLDYVGNFDEPYSLILQDDRDKEPGELFPGHLPGLGYRIEELPESGSMGIVASLYSSQGFEGDPAHVAQQIRTQPDIEVDPFFQAHEERVIPGVLRTAPAGS